MDEDLVVWNDSFAVGFTPIDDQHKGLVSMINELVKGSREGDSVADATLMEVFEKTVEYARTHFADEEKILTEVLYPELEAQKKQHQHFMFEVVNIVTDVESGKTTHIEMVKFLKTWLMHHIVESDKKYIPFLSKVGRKGFEAFLK